jgi:DNA-binding response OmpR family regulator
MEMQKVWPQPCASLTRAAAVQAGLALAQAERFDVIILDNRFDNSSGVGISSVHEFSERAAAGVVMLTAYGNDELEKDARLLGAGAYLPKPVDPETLLDAVRRMLAGPRRRQAP